MWMKEGIPYEGNGYGLGVASFENPSGKEWGKGGDGIGYASRMRYFPDQGGATVVTMANSTNIDPAIATNPNADADFLENPPIFPVQTVLSASVDTLRQELD